MIIATTGAEGRTTVRATRPTTRAALRSVAALVFIFASPAVASPPTAFRGLAWGTPPAEGMVKKSEFATSALYRTTEHPSPLFGVPVSLEDYFYSIDAKLFAVRVVLNGEANFRQMLTALQRRFGAPTTPGSWNWEGSKVKIFLNYEAATERSLLFFSNDDFEVEDVGCRDPAALSACVKRWSAMEMKAADIERFVHEGLPDCFPMEDQNALWRIAECLPLQLGRDARNGKTLELVYHCSDVCPGNGRVFLIYGDVDEKSCCAVGGSPYAYPGWKEFAGCRPPEMQRPEPVRDADGKMKFGIRSTCDANAQPTIVGDLPTPRPNLVCTVDEIEAEPEDGLAPLTVQFEAKADCAGKPVQYTWDFGDGSRGADTPRLSHTYRNPGEYTVTVVVRSQDGDYEPDETDVSVNVRAK